MRKDFLLFLSFLVDAGYIVSFRVTKDKIFREFRLPYSGRVSPAPKIRQPERRQRSKSK